MSQRKARTARQQNPPRVQGPRPLPRRKPLWVGAIAAVGLVVLVAGVLLARHNSGPAQATPALHTGSAGLSLTGTDPVSGKNVSLTSYTGKPIVLNIWASWCPGCNEEAADLARFAASHPQAQVIGIDINDTKSGARAFYRRHGWKHPSIYDPQSQIADRLGLQGLPTTFFLNRQHQIVARIVGASNLAGFEQGLRQATQPA